MTRHVRVLECLPDLKLSESRAVPKPKRLELAHILFTQHRSSPEPEGGVNQPQNSHSVTLGPHKKIELVVNSAPKELIKHTRDHFIILIINS